MIFSNAQKFVGKIQRWRSIFNVLFWVLALLPVGVFAFLVAMDPPFRSPAAAFLVLLGMIVYVAMAFLLHRLCLITLDFMKSLIEAVGECQHELKQIKENLNSDREKSDLVQTAPRQSPYNF